MNHEIPMLNKICGYKQIKRAWDIHQSKLKNLKGSIDLEPPKKYIFEKKKPLHNAILATNRTREIEFQNQILLQKLTHPQKQPSHHAHPHSQSTSCDFSTHIIKQRLRNIESRALHQSNSKLLKRIKQKKTHYQLKGYLKERQNVQKYINLMSRFPYKNLPKNKTPVKFWMRNDPTKYSTNGFLNLSKSSETLMNSNANFLTINKHFQGCTYQIEGTQSAPSGRITIIIRNLMDTHQSHDIQIDETNGRQILKKYFAGQLSKMLHAICYNPSKKQFYIKFQFQDQNFQQNNYDTFTSENKMIK